VLSMHAILTAATGTAMIAGPAIPQRLDLAAASRALETP
jgi:hypothetical protein